MLVTHRPVYTHTGEKTIIKAVFCFHVCSHLQHKAVQIFQVYREPRCGQIRLKGERVEENKTGHRRLVGFTFLILILGNMKFNWNYMKHYWNKPKAGWGPRFTLLLSNHQGNAVPSSLLQLVPSWPSASFVATLHVRNTAVSVFSIIGAQLFFYCVAIATSHNEWALSQLKSNPNTKGRSGQCLTADTEDRKCFCLAIAVSSRGAVLLVDTCPSSLVGCWLICTNNPSWTLNVCEIYLKMWWYCFVILCHGCVIWGHILSWWYFGRLSYL